MEVHTVVAFQWSGTGYNATYNTSHTATLSDNDSSYDGSGDIDETVSIDGAAATATSGPPYAIKVSFTDTEGAPHVETFYFFNTDGSWYFVPGADSSFTEGATLGTYQSHTVGWDYATVTCFANGTVIETALGPTLVENLVAGDRIKVLDGTYRRLQLNLCHMVPTVDLLLKPKLRPIKFRANSLGKGYPDKDLLVSRQHRMLVTSPISKRMFGHSQALVSAIKFVGWPGCFIDNSLSKISYHHLVFDQHEIVFANGTPSESFYPGPEAMKAMTHQAREEFLDLFPEFSLGREGPEPARFLPSGPCQRKLISRHMKNNKPLIVRAELDEV